MSKDSICLKTWYYQQFDADYSSDAPGEGFGGWKSADLELAPERTAVAFMHAWDGGTREQYPGWHRCEEYFPRSEQICREVFPPLLAAVRASALRPLHVACLPYAAKYPGYQEVVKLVGPEPSAPEPIRADPVVERLRAFKQKRSFVGEHNVDDCDRGWKNVDFPADAKPRDDEWVATTSHQLIALCRRFGITHIVCACFAVNWCLVMSPGGMMDLSRAGVFCATIGQAVTAVENRESARGEKYKEEGLWRVAIAFGFVYDVDDFTSAIRQTRKS
jgi:hypothetical protein